MNKFTEFNMSFYNVNITFRVNEIQFYLNIPLVESMVQWVVSFPGFPEVDPG